MRRIAAEYSDEVRKLNKKEELLLEKKLRIFTRQEKVAESTHKKSLIDIHRLSKSIHKHRKMPDLEEIDKWKTFSQAGLYGAIPTEKPKLGGPMSMLRKAMQHAKTKESNHRMKKEQSNRVVRLPPLERNGGNKDRGFLSGPPGVLLPEVTLSRSPRPRKMPQNKPKPLSPFQNGQKVGKREYVDRGMDRYMLPATAPPSGLHENPRSKAVLVGKNMIKMKSRSLDTEVVQEQLKEGEVEVPEIVGDTKEMTEEWVVSSIRHTSARRSSVQSTSDIDKDVDNGHCSR